jgi:hypothetical protein
VFLISASTRASIKNGTRIVLYEDVPKARAHEPESTGLAGREALAHTALGTRCENHLVCLGSPGCPGSRGHTSQGPSGPSGPSGPAQIQVAIAPSSHAILACMTVKTVETGEAAGAAGAPSSKDSGKTVGE